MKIKSLVPIMFALACVGVVAFSTCTSTEFGGRSSTKKKPTGKPEGTVTDDDAGDDDSDDEGDEGEDPTKGFDPGTVFDTGDKEPEDPIREFDSDNFAGGTIVKQLEPEQNNSIWGVTTKGEATYMRLDGDEVKDTKKWSGVTGGGGGARTYVTEGGVVISKTGGHLYWIDPASTPQGDLKSLGAKHYHKLPGPGADDRVCVVSYKKDKKRFLGMGYGMGKFVEIPMENSAPFAPKFGTISREGTAGSTRWGYSCFVDQDRLIYYSQWANMSEGPILAIDLKTMTAKSATTAPNGSFTSTNLINETIGPKPEVRKGSYAVTGDRDGNVLNGLGIYTFSYEARSKTIWAAGSSNGLLTIYPAKCLSKEPTCSGFGSFNMNQMNINVGPLSGLGDGRMIGLFRGVGTVFLMKLKDDKDISKGIDATAIHNLEGDPYMYTDFTGATLYLTKSETTFDLTEMDDYSSKKENRGIGFTWLDKSGKGQTFEDIKLEVRCYKKSDSAGSYQSWSKVKDSTEQTVILASSCKNKKYDQVDVRLTQLADNDTLMRITKIQVTAYQ
jgi:hypothetical protein